MRGPDHVSPASGQISFFMEANLCPVSSPHLPEYSLFQPPAPAVGILHNQQMSNSGMDAPSSPRQPPAQPTPRPPSWTRVSMVLQPPARAPSRTRVSTVLHPPHPRHGALRGPTASPSRALPSLAHLGLLCLPTCSPKGLIPSWTSPSCPRARELLGLRPLPTQLRALLTPCESHGPSKSNCLRGGLGPLSLGQVWVPRLGA